MKKVLKSIAFSGIAAIFPIVASAQVVPPTAYDPNHPLVDTAGAGKITGLIGFYGYLTIILGYLIGIFWILAVAFLIFAAIKYLTARGDTEQIKKAQHMVIYGVVGVVVALLATGIRGLIGNILLGQ